MDAEETGIIAGPPRREGLLAWSLLEGAWLALIVAVVGFAVMAAGRAWIALFGLHGLVGVHVLRTERARLAAWFAPSRRAVLLGVAGGVALLAFNAAYGWALERLGFTPPDVPEMLRGMLPMPLVYLWAAVLAPVVEELYFRGRLLEALEARMGGWAPAAVTSALFAAIHMIPEFFPALVVFALALLGLKRKTGGLLAPIIAHAINNSVALF
jgi:membrane protease YdiL (CAAX protease family)